MSEDAPLWLEYGGARVHVTGRARTIVLSHLRDSEQMHLDTIKSGGIEFSWGKRPGGGRKLNWQLRQYGEAVSDDDWPAD